METPGASVLDSLSLLAEVADDLVLKSVRDTHLAVLDRVDGVTSRLGGGPGPSSAVHRGIAGAIYGGLGVGLRATSKGFDKAAATGVGPKVEATRKGRFLTAAVNGLIGDKLLRERPHMAIPMAVRRGGHDVWLDRPELAAAFPEATGHLAVFLHGLCEDDEAWLAHEQRTGTTYAATVSELGFTPVMLRANSGLPLRENGVALSALLGRLVEEWPVPVTRIVLVGHSMGGLVIRAASAVAAEPAPAWIQLVSDVVTLGTPHLGAPIAWGVGHGSRGLSFLPETKTFGRILDLRSRGVHDLVVGLAEDVPALPHATYHLVAATLTDSPRHPVGNVVGDLLVRERSAYGRDRRGRDLFPGAETVHVGGSDHFGLLNHPRVHERLRAWLA